MPKFNVGWSYEEGGYCVIEADTEAEARTKMVEHLDDVGNADFEFMCHHFDIVHRDAQIVEVEKIDERK